MKKYLILCLLLSPVVFSSLLGTAEDVRFDQPALITSAGQAAEVHLANVLFKRAGLTATLNKTAEAADLEGHKTLILVLGVSLKGLGAAGIDAGHEKKRVESLLLAADEQSIPILCLHLGGEARRGDLSDQMIKTCLPHAAAVLVVKDGNKDGLFTAICRNHNIPLIEVEKTVYALEPLKNYFRQDRRP
ncbi:MAG: hypothetical protein KJ727_05165 [Acidobacteria bacterium]|nr:hypothetical protein [Acidobacteriota bacterium]MBU4330975.1 hypothetical protein [Acidobacteriota bacterium]MBU4495186.1 hypothetical protein [Acidobacteriota bacterium]MCG2817024.1 DUF6305 family protein [Candidatus Aminicenantes bacterium]